MNQVFRNGIPYGPDFGKLDATFTDLTEGVLLTHPELEAALGIKRRSSRYYAVVNAWVRRKRASMGIFMVWESKVGLRVLDPASILTFSEARFQQKLVQTGRSIRNFGYVDRDRLNGLGQQRLDHQLQVAMKIRDAVESARKELAIGLSPIASLPQRSAKSE